MIILRIILLLVMSLSLQAQNASQDKLDLPGDNLNLYAVLKIFRESETLEAFERTLNDDSSQVNNLDLDGDNQIDYIRVSDYPDGAIHNITLKVAVSKDEDQDVAVIVVKKLADGKVEIQLIGDEDLYGKNYIVEPNIRDDENTASETPNPGYTRTVQLDDGETVRVETVTTYQISQWPVVQYVFIPTYTVWRSPWYWSHYPAYWRPWKPHYWHYYYGYHFHWQYHYFSHYRRWPQYRVPGWYNRYYGSSFRSRSVVFQNRYRQGAYRNTYSRPQMAVQGSAVFVKRYPKAPSVNTKLPAFDKTGRPVVARPGLRPGTGRPGDPTPGTRPVVTKPGVTRPATRPGLTRPVTRPGVTKPVTRPGVTRPATRPGTRPPVTKPVNRPGIRPVTKPAGTRPVTKPVTRPATRPSTRPANRPIESRPVTRPVV
ncbi:MAG: hypothetical protein EOP49_21555 [Sphingobacteriales bacterium]|nr:MAG: hypothetical protein EOP49_21555 [Sphingobacteriales bacterium]